MTIAREGQAWRRATLVGLLVASAAARAGVLASAADGPEETRTTLRGYLESFALDREARELLDRPGSWDDDRTNLAIRTLARITLAPPEFAVRWSADAVAEEDIADPPEDRHVRITGTAELVAPVDLPVGVMLGGNGRDSTPRTRVDLVRVRSSRGAVVDVLTPSAPRAWPRGRAFAERALVIGLPVAAGAGPRPEWDGEGMPAGWPAEPPSLLVVATRVAWQRDDLAGRGGMDAGLFDTVTDGVKLTSGDADAFFGLLAAAGRTDPGALAEVAGRPRPILPLIDPARHWFADHRGEPVAIEGTALRATRVEIDDPVRRRQTGIDHYWEVFVSVATPPIEVEGKVMDRYPVVCCLRALPEGMPTGTSIAEPVRVAAFAFKSYAWPLPSADGTPRRREAPLLVGGDVSRMRPAASPRGGVLEWMLTGLAAVIALGFGAAWWMARREARQRDRRRRASLPDRLSPPGAPPGG